MLGPVAIVVTKVKSVVSPDDNDCIVRHTGFLESRKNPSELIIGETCGCEITVDQTPGVSLRNGGIQILVTADLIGRIGKCVASRRGCAASIVTCQVNLRRIVEIPEALRTREGEMWLL